MDAIYLEVLPIEPHGGLFFVILRQVGGNVCHPVSELLNVVIWQLFAHKLHTAEEYSSPELITPAFAGGKAMLTWQ